MGLQLPLLLKKKRPDASTIMGNVVHNVTITLTMIFMLWGCFLFNEDLKMTRRDGMRLGEGGEAAIFSEARCSEKRRSLEEKLVLP